MKALELYDDEDRDQEDMDDNIEVITGEDRLGSK